MKECTNKSMLKKTVQLLPWLWLAAGYILDMWYQLVPGHKLIDSDLASDMILASILNQDHSFLLTHNWCYSTEIKVVGLPIFYRIGLLLFPDNWTAARVFGMAIGLALYAAMMFVFARTMGLGQAGVWMTAALLWPFGRGYLVYAVFAGYYFLYTFLYMAVLALLLRGKNAKSRRKWAIYLVLACAVSLIAGTNGIKELMIFHAPFILAVFIVLAIALNTCQSTEWQSALQRCKGEIRLAGGALCTVVAAFAGYLFNCVILQKQYEFKSFGSVSWNRFGLFTLDRVIMDFFHEFGYQDGVGVFHFSGIASGVGLLVGAWLALCIVRLALRYKKLNTAERTMLVLLVTMIVVCGVSYTYFSNYCQYFWLTCMPVAFAVMAIEIKTEELHLPGTRAAMAVVLSGALTFCSINNVRQEIEHPSLAHVGLDKVADWLVDNGYREGYATFWNGNAMTEMTSGQLDVWMPGDLNSIDIEGWLQPTYHLTRYPKHPFILVDTETDGAVENAGLIRNGNGTEVYNDGRYVVYAFDSAEEICSAAETTAAERAATQKSENN